MSNKSKFPRPVPDFYPGKKEIKEWMKNWTKRHPGDYTSEQFFKLFLMNVGWRWNAEDVGCIQHPITKTPSSVLGMHKFLEQTINELKTEYIPEKTL